MLLVDESTVVKLTGPYRNNFRRLLLRRFFYGKVVGDDICVEAALCIFFLAFCIFFLQLCVFST